MSEILQKTFRALVGSDSGVGWSAPSASNPHSLSPQLAAALRQLATVPRSEEKALAKKQISQCVQVLSQPSTTPSLATECIVRGIFIHLIGQDASELQVHAIKLAQAPSLLHRKLGYLACGLLLPADSQLRLLLPNCILRELSSNHEPAIITGLIAASNLMTDPSVLPVISVKVTRLVSHKNHLVRTKALITLDKCCQLSVDLWPEVEEAVLTSLSDPNPQVVATAVQLLAKYASCSSDAASLILDPVLHVQRQITSGRLPSEFNYKGFLAPWLQVDILRLLSRYRDFITMNSNYSAAVSDVVSKMMEIENMKDSMAQILVSETIELVSRIDSLANFIPPALQYISKFLRSKHISVKHTGLDLLHKVLRSNPQVLTQNQEEVVLFCLEHPDTAIQLKTLGLVTSLVNKDNLNNLVNSVLVFFKKNKASLQNNPVAQSHVLELDRLIGDLATDLDWKTNSILRLLQCSGEEARPVLLEHIKFLLDPTTGVDLEELEGVRAKITKLLGNLVESGVRNPVIIELLVWSRAQFATESNSEAVVKQLIDLNPLVPVDSTCLVNALLVIATRSQSEAVRELATDFLHTKAAQINQPRVKEASLQTLKLLDKIGGVCVIPDLRSLDHSLSFLDQIVYQNLCQGGTPYLSKTLRSRGTGIDDEEEAEGRPLDLAPYNRIRRDTHNSVGSSSKSGPKLEPKGIWSLEGRVKDSEEDTTAVEEGNTEQLSKQVALPQQQSTAVVAEARDDLLDGW